MVRLYNQHRGLQIKIIIDYLYIYIYVYYELIMISYIENPSKIPCVYTPIYSSTQRDTPQAATIERDANVKQNRRNRHDNSCWDEPD